LKNGREIGFSLNPDAPLHVSGTSNYTGIKMTTKLMKYRPLFYVSVTKSCLSKKSFQKNTKQASHQLLPMTTY
jgi:hypothetical protein